MTRWLVVGALVLAGCATAPNRFSSPELERTRSQCLEKGGLWLETAERFDCRAPGRPEQAGARPGASTKGA